jgi:hypothetical protein
MTLLLAVVYSFLFGLLHGILPDEHTWPITFSYAIGGASGREGLRAGLFFSAAFTLQRTLLSEVAYLALAPFLLSPTINGIVYVVVGLAMSVAGATVVRRNRVPHLHLLGHHHGSQTGGRTLFFGGLLFAVVGIATLLGLTSHLPVDAGYLLIGSFMIVVAVPAFVYSLREVLAASKQRDVKRKQVRFCEGRSR